MKSLKFIVVTVFLLAQINGIAQEKKIAFKKGVLKICSSKNFEIKGYDGNEVVIKSLHKHRKNLVYFSSRKSSFLKGNLRSLKNDSLRFPTMIYNNSGAKKQKKGLRKLGKNTDSENGIYLKIEQKNGELILSDKDDDNSFIMISGESYKVLIPNSLKLLWDTKKCTKTIPSNVHFYNSKTSSLSDFSGEVEITSSMNNLKLKDVIGPVSINSLGGNVKIIFDKELPQKLYSIYTNNGYIDVAFPQSSNVLVDAKAIDIYSNLEFNILSDKENNGIQEMKLKLKSGKVKMKLNSGYGSIYLRKN